MGDKQDRHAAALLHLPQQIKDLGLNGDIQGRGRFIGDQKGRLAGQGHGDHRPLFHASGKLKGIIAAASGRIGNTHRLKHGHGPFSGLLARQLEVLNENFRHLVPDGHDRIQAQHRLLKNHADPSASNLTHFQFREG